MARADSGAGRERPAEGLGRCGNGRKILPESERRTGPLLRWNDRRLPDGNDGSSGIRCGRNGDRGCGRYRERPNRSGSPHSRQRSRGCRRYVFGRRRNDRNFGGSPDHGLRNDGGRDLRGTRHPEWNGDALRRDRGSERTDRDGFPVSRSSRLNIVGRRSGWAFLLHAGRNGREFPTGGSDGFRCGHFARLRRDHYAEERAYFDARGSGKCILCFCAGTLDAAPDGEFHRKFRFRQHQGGCSGPGKLGDPHECTQYRGDGIFSWRRGGHAARQRREPHDRREIVQNGDAPHEFRDRCGKLDGRRFRKGLSFLRRRKGSGQHLRQFVHESFRFRRPGLRGIPA